MYLETGIKKKRKHYLNMNIMRNIPFHLHNSLKKEMKRVVLPLIPEEYIGINIQKYELHYEVWLPNLLKRDISNVCSVIDKFVCDALVESNVLIEDNYLHLQYVTYKFGGMDETGRGYVSVTVKEVIND